MSEETKSNSDFAALANEPHASLLRELWGFLRQNKKWWLGPIVMVLLLFGALVVLAGSSVAPFIYTLF
ncbi:MAG TPA: DUF5989 family protein [Polyangiaceae bacterium]|nr:DUF5989 family protein [Polyangiaceae bacterium]